MLSLTFQLFFECPAESLYQHYLTQFRQRGDVVEDRPQPEWRSFEFHRTPHLAIVRPNLYPLEDPCALGDVLTLTAEFDCPALMVTVDDGDFWAYWLVDRGRQVDQFIQNPDRADDYFPGLPTGGQADRLARLLGLPKDEVAAYLVQQPARENLEPGDLFGPSPQEQAADMEYDQLNIKARPGDQWTRFQECSVLDFLRLVGVPVELRSPHVVIEAPCTGRFWWQPGPSGLLSASPK